MMDDNSDKINELLLKLDFLYRKQKDFSKEISDLRSEINSLKTPSSESTSSKKEIVEDRQVKKVEILFKEEKLTPRLEKLRSERKLSNSDQESESAPKIKIDLEKFIGENIISKIGIAITIIGVAIGAKYSIEHELISPLTRIILGYLTGIGLLGFGMKLKKNYESYSAVLVGGAIAIMYFITYAAYDFYDLVPQTFAFGLMLVFTAFTVFAAINYNRQVIAHIGLVGAYAVPFLLGDDSGNVIILFSYVAIINIGILVIAFRKYWKALYYSAFVVSWLIYFSWYVTEYQNDEHFALATIFLTLFFAIFYITFLTYKLLQKEKFDKVDILMLLANSFIFYGIGYAILGGSETGEQYLGLFTVGNALIHFIISAIIFKQKLADKNLFYLVSGLVLVFITIAIPVQLDGNWVSLLWAGEAALLFWIGRTRNIRIYEKLSYFLMFLALFSIIHDWATVYGAYSQYRPEAKITPILNINFLTSILFTGAFVFINFINQSKQYTSPLDAKKWHSTLMLFSIPAILLISLYFMFQLEIANYWDQLYTDSLLRLNLDGTDSEKTYWNKDLRSFKSIWLINFTLLFASLLSLINIQKIRSQSLGYFAMLLGVFAIVLFFINGLILLSDLRVSYIDQNLSDYYNRGIFHITIRYISFAFIALSITALYRQIREDYIDLDFKIVFDFILYASILVIASNELINWTEIAKTSQTDKLGLSILWGIYALFLIVLGIWKKKKHLRIGAIVLFGLTLFKLFLYDISHLNTISKTIVFVSLGILLLIISFLYNKYKHLISDEIHA